MARAQNYSLVIASIVLAVCSVCVIAILYVARLRGGVDIGFLKIIGMFPYSAPCLGSSLILWKRKRLAIVTLVAGVLPIAIVWFPSLASESLINSLNSMIGEFGFIIILSGVVLPFVCVFASAAYGLDRNIQSGRRLELGTAVLCMQFLIILIAIVETFLNQSFLLWL